MKPMYIESPEEFNTNLGENFMKMIMSLPKDNDFRDKEIETISELDAAKDRDDIEMSRFATEQDIFWGIK